MKTSESQPIRTVILKSVLLWGVGAFLGELNCWVWAASLPDSSPDSSRLILKSALEVVNSKNPDIQSLEHQRDSAEAKARQALAPTEPTFSVTFNDMSRPLSPSLMASTVLQITQPLGFPGKALLNHSALSEQAEALTSQLQATRLQVFTSLKTAYYQLGLAQENIRINQEQQASLERILSIAQRRYETGSITQVDFLNAEVALGSNQNDLADLQVSERTARAQLNVLLSNPADTPLSIESLLKIKLPLLPDLENRKQGFQQMLNQRPEIKAAGHTLGAANRTAQLAWMSVLPDFSFSVGSTIYNIPQASPIVSLPEGLTHTFLASVQLTVPIWFLLNERETIVGASHDRAAAEANLDSVLNQSKTLFETTVATLEASHRKLENYEKHLIPRSEQAFNAALLSYSTGKIDYLTLADTATARRNIRRDYFALLVNYLTSAASYGQLIGEDL